MNVVRPEVTLLLDNPAAWPPAMLDMAQGDVLVVFDIRRYENVVLQLTEMAREQGAEIILITDCWGYHLLQALPRITFACHIEAPSSNLTLVVLIETLLSAVQELTWGVTEGRMQRMGELYARTRLFRRRRQEAVSGSGHIIYTSNISGLAS